MNKHRRSLGERLHLDWPLLGGLLILLTASLVILYSASGENTDTLTRQGIHIAVSLSVMVILAQFSPGFYARWAPPVFIIGVVLLILVLLIGDVGKGAQRWLEIGSFRFQPSEALKLAMPITIAAYISRYPLPPSLLHVALAFALVLVPTLLIAKQPDLGTSLLVAASGLFVIFLAGLPWRLIMLALAGLAAFLPALWYFLMHDYQKRRVLTLLNPESDPLGAGYHIIQSKIAIGSGGLWGKGWLHGTQSQLEFLPERHTDFIFAVLAEEFGLVGVSVLILMYLFIIGRGLQISVQAQGAFPRLLAGALTLTFFVYVFVNIGMVSGLLPVVGVPLPLISYGGTSMVTLMAGFGILMSVHTHKRLLAK
ncbi:MULTISPECIES: rod shape-determining protein RodA [Oceanimonas]|uniref:Peptidoglycan glycosyltransferase MrdB n=1 Tax=Oceanimonas smirnovii TaxID=264574 RepID=A0ABW7P203_9GAMM|nr:MULTISPECIES: rod shape-determining protein RodA [Oceanimonas]MDV2858058.1 rod shape-determining protein RodA [Oceanimonas sp. CAM02]